MATIETTIESLNDLVQINNDRIEGYQKAIEELSPEDEDLKSLFVSMINESQQCKMELATEIAANGGDIAEGTTGSGKIYRAWMDIKAVFTGHGRKAILENCHAGEDAAQKAYESALNDDDIPSYIKEIITRQQGLLKASHDRIKALRNIEE